MSAIKIPIGIEKSNIDAVFAIKDVYGDLVKYMNEVAVNPEDLSTSGRTGVRWAAVGGESYIFWTRTVFWLLTELKM